MAGGHAKQGCSSQWWGRSLFMFGDKESCASFKHIELKVV
jgi:hypothetical protein